MYKALHQTIRSSEKHAALSDYAERIWIRGLVAADMVGRLTASPKKFHVEAIPMLPYDEGKLQAAFGELKAAKLCHFYEVDGKPFMVFHDHDEHNKAARNLRNIKSLCPPPKASLCSCVMYTKYESEEASTVPTVEPTVVGTTAVPFLSSPVHVPDPDLVPVQEGVQGEDAAPESDAWTFSMVKVLQDRGCPNKAPTIRTWVKTIAGRLTRQRAEELFRFGKVANMPVTEIYDVHCKESANGNGKQSAPGARSTGKFSLPPGELDKRIS